jgi:hypothetical protein
MSRSLKNRVARLEEILGRKGNAPLVTVHEGESMEEALERHFQEHPDYRDSITYIFIDGPPADDAEEMGGSPLDPFRQKPPGKPEALLF